MIERAVGLVLTRVEYFNLPDTEWEITPGMHRLDFGLDLTFVDSTIGVTWSSPGQRLEILPSSIRPSVPRAVATDVSGTRPWPDIVGRRLLVMTNIHAQDPEDEAGSARWALAIRFEGTASVWLAAANVVDQPPALLPFGDELLVIHDPTVAKRLGVK